MTNKPLEVKLSPEMQDQIDEDPNLREAIVDFISMMTKAAKAVEAGEY